MATALATFLALGPFILSGFSVSYAAWPKLGLPLKIAAAIPLGAMMFTVHLFLLASTRSGAGVVGLTAWALLWFLVGMAAHLLLNSDRGISKKLERTPGLRYAHSLGLKRWVGIISLILFLLAFLLIPLLVDLNSNLVWRYRAYLAALGGVAFFGAYSRKKVNTLVVGLAVVALVSLLAWWFEAYPVGTPLLQANSLIQEGFQADLPILGESGVGDALGMLSPFALAGDTIVAVLAVVLIGLSAVILTNALVSRGTTRTILILILVLILLVPGLLIPYAYSLGVGGLEFGATLGMGALKGYTMVDVIQRGELDSDTLRDLEDSIVRAGQDFNKSEALLGGLEQLKLFEFVSLLPVVGGYSQTGRSLAWGLTNAALGLQTSGLGILGILDGILSVFGESEAFGSFDILGPRLLEEELDEELVAEGIAKIDSAFAQVRRGFPRVRSSLGNLSEIEPEVFQDRLPDVASGLDELLANTQEITLGIDIADVMLGESSSEAVATHFILAAYSLTKIAPNLTDLRDVRALPSFDHVLSNLSYVSSALDDPVIVDARNEGGDAGDSMSFLVDTIDLVERMATMGDLAVQVAEEVEEIESRFEDKRIYDYTDIEIDTWIKDAETLTEHSRELEDQIEDIEDSIRVMLAKAKNESYGYANELAGDGIGLLGEVLEFLKLLKELTTFSTGLESLVRSVENFNEFHDDFIRLERQIRDGNLGIALQTERQAAEELRQGRLQAEALLESLERLPVEIQLPIAEEEISGVVDAAATIELRMSHLESQLSQGDQEGAMETLNGIKQHVSELVDELQLNS